MSSNRAINILGERFREDKEETGDRKKLDEFRSSFGDAFRIVIKKLREILEGEKDCVLNDRQTKTYQSIKYKLKRENGMKLSTMQDIRGCRIIVKGDL